MKFNRTMLLPLILALLITLLMGTASACTGPDCSDHKDPGAKLTVSPDPADINEQVGFDATGSYDHDGRIVKYKFDFDNDGVYDRVDYDGVVYKRFSTTGSKKTTVKVVDNDGRSSRATKIHRVENSAESCRIVSGFLNLEKDDIHDGESTEAYLNVYNYGRTQEVSVTFKVDDVTVSKSTKVVGADGNERFSTSVSPNEDAEVRAIVDTVGGPCGDKEVVQHYEDLDVISQPEREEAKLNVMVVDQEDQPIEDARVSVTGRESNLKHTDSRGRASMRLKSGWYEIEVNKDRYSKYTNEITLQEGQEDTLRVKLRNRYQEAELRVRTEDRTGDPLRNSKIIAKNGEQQTKYTDIDGETLFSLEPGTYEVTAEKSNYGLQQRTLDLEPGETHSTTFEMSERPPIEPGEANLRIHVEGDNGRALEDARVEIVNGDTEVGHTNRNGNTDFVLGPDTYEIRVSKQGYSTEYRTVRLEEGDDKRLSFRLQDRQTDTASLQVQVRSEAGERLQDADVKVTGEMNREKRTDNRGRTDFLLRSGRYSITASKSGYITEERTVRLSQREEETVRFRLQEADNTRGHITLDQVSYSSRVCSGDDLDVQLGVSNAGDSSQRISLGVRGLGDETVDRFTVSAGESRARTLTLDNVQGSGSERIRIAVTNGDTHVETRTVEVRDCDNGGTGPGDSGNPSAVSMQVTPQELQIGKMVRVTGYVDGVRGPTDVTIRANGQRMATVATEPDGYYEAYIRPENTGRTEVTAMSGERTASQQINVLPTVEVASMNAPDRVFEDEMFRICSDVESQMTPQVVLRKDGEEIDSRSADGRVCFRTEAGEPGETDYTIRASARGVSDSETRNVEVLEIDNEVENFPDKVAMVRSGEGIVRVRLYNTHNTQRRYNLRLSGVPDDWFAQTEKTTVLQSGEEESVYFYITPKAEGTFYPQLTVDANGNRVHSQEIRVWSGGTLDSQKSWKDKILSLLRW